MARPRASISGRRLPLFFCRRELLFRAAESLIFWGPPTAVILSRPSVVIFFAADCPGRWPLKFFSVDRRQSLASGRKPLFFPFRPPHPPLVPSAPLPPASSAPCPLCSLSVRLIRPLSPLLPFRPPHPPLVPSAPLPPASPLLSFPFRRLRVLLLPRAKWLSRTPFPEFWIRDYEL